MKHLGFRSTTCYTYCSSSYFISLSRSVRWGVRWSQMSKAIVFLTCQASLLAVIGIGCICLGCTARQQPGEQRPPTTQAATQPVAKAGQSAELPPAPGWVTSVRQLQRASREGTFQYVEQIEVNFSSQPVPVRASISTSANSVKVQELNLIAIGVRTHLNVDLRPGTYLVSLNASSTDGVTEYQPVLLPEFHIDKSGTLSYLHSDDKDAHFVLKVKGMMPSHDMVVSEARPTLRWDAVPDAAYYAVRSFDDKFSGGETKAVSFTIKDPLDGDECGWTVTAFGTDHRTLATGSAWFLTRGSPAPTPPPSSAPAEPAGGYIGIAVLDWAVGMVGKPMTSGDGKPNGWIILASDWGNVRPALCVRAILPDSPAIDAGLLPGDVIDQIDGKPVQGGADMKGQIDRFVTQIRSLPPGTLVKLRVLRNGERPRVAEVKLAGQ
jgi:hypothetical protein